MDQKRLSIWLKAVVVGCALCGVALFGVILPGFLANQAAQHSGFPNRAWTVFMWVMAVPCYAVLVCVWRIAGQIARNNSFSRENAMSLRIIALLAGLDAALLLVGNAVFLALGRSVPMLSLVSAFVCFAGLAISVGAACLSHLVLKAAGLQEENDLTI